MTELVVGVIGLGNIGGGVARNLARAGHAPVVFDLDVERTAEIVELGGVGAESVVAAVEAADVVFTSLPGPQQIAAVGAEILPAMRQGAIWVELSTNDLDTARSLAEQASAVGVRLVDAPVSGGPEGAEAATLSIFVGGDDDAVARVAPLLEVIGTKIDHLGPRGAGIVAKIAQVILCYTQTITLIEAMLLGVKGGVEPAKMLDLIRNSAGTSYAADVYGPEILAGTYDASFPLGHATKDMRLARELAATMGVVLPMTEAVAELYAEAEREFGAQVGHCQAAQLIEKQNDLILHQQSGATP